jgi:hypothetical protein
VLSTGGRYRGGLFVASSQKPAGVWGYGDSSAGGRKITAHSPFFGARDLAGFEEFACASALRAAAMPGVGSIPPVPCHRRNAQGRPEKGLRRDHPAARSTNGVVAKYELGERRLDVLEYLDIAAAIGFDPREPLEGC